VSAVSTADAALGAFVVRPPGSAFESAVA